MSVAPWPWMAEQLYDEPESTSYGYLLQDHGTPQASVPSTATSVQAYGGLQTFEDLRGQWLNRNASRFWACECSVGPRVEWCFGMSLAHSVRATLLPPPGFAEKDEVANLPTASLATNARSWEAHCDHDAKVCQPGGGGRSKV